jgi:molybdopterin synthase catalytic subunit
MRSPCCPRSPVDKMSYLTRAPIVVDRLVSATAAPGLGGACVFLGTVRSGPDERGVTGIEYSGYESMVEAELGRIDTEVHERWPGARTAVRHRLGLVPAGEASIGIAVAAPHRAAAFDACRYIIEAVKQRVPVWKKELRTDGTALWVDPSGHPTAAGPPGPR